MQTSLKEELNVPFLPELSNSNPCFAMKCPLSLFYTTILRRQWSNSGRAAPCSTRGKECQQCEMDLLIVSQTFSFESPVLIKTPRNAPLSICNNKDSENKPIIFVRTGCMSLPKKKSWRSMSLVSLVVSCGAQLRIIFFRGWIWVLLNAGHGGWFTTV